MMKEQRIRLPDDITISKLEDIIYIELKTIEEILKITENIENNIKKLDISLPVKDKLLHSYIEGVNEMLNKECINKLVYYTKLLAYTKVLSKNKKLYAYENNWGEINVTYLPYIVYKNECARIDCK